MPARHHNKMASVNQSDLHGGSPWLQSCDEKTMISICLCWTATCRMANKCCFPSLFFIVILKRHDFVLLSKHEVPAILNIQGNYSCVKFFFAASFFFLLFLLFVRWFLGLDDKAELMHRSDTVQCIIPLFYTVSIVICWGVIPPDELSSFYLFLALLSVYHEIVYPILDE